MQLQNIIEGQNRWTELHKSSGKLDWTELLKSLGKLNWTELLWTVINYPQTILNKHILKHIFHIFQSHKLEFSLGAVQFLKTELKNNSVQFFIQKHSILFFLPQFSSIQFSFSTAHFSLLQTIADADKDNDGKISREDWKAFVSRNPSLLINMTLPYLKYGWL